MTGDIRIRKYRDDDFDSLARIHDPARKNELALAGLSEAFLPFTVASRREGLFEYEICVAEVNGEPVGFVAYEPEEIAWLYVDVHHARQGIGKALVRFAAERVDPDADIEVLEGNTPAIALYEACGFRIVRTVYGVMPGNESFRVTVKVLQRPEEGCAAER